MQPAIAVLPLISVSVVNERSALLVLAWWREDARLTRASAIRSPETAQCDEVARSVGVSGKGREETVGGIEAGQEMREALFREVGEILEQGDE